MPEMMQALSIVLSHQLPRIPADALFVHALNDLEEDLLAFANKLHSTGIVRKVVLNGSTAEECERVQIDYRGRERWELLAEQVGIPSQYILWTPTALHTYAEAEAVQRICSENGWKTLIVVGAPYHILRCTLTQLGAMKRLGCARNLFPATLRGFDWWHVVTKKIMGGSSFTKSRLDMLDEELERIHRYQEKGDCVSLAELIGHFRLQDRQ